MASRGPDFATGRVLELTDGAVELREILDSASARSQLVLVDFSVSWCGPCRMLAPVLDALATHTGRVVVIKIDCERTPANRSLAASASISAYPTLKFYADGAVVETLRGANPGVLRASVARHLAALGPPPPVGGPNLAAALAAALGRVKSGCTPDEFMTAAKALAGIVSKIVEHPQDPKYRTIKLSNTSYKAKLGSRVGGRECMEILGFKERTEAMEAVLVMDRVPENLGAVVGFLNAAINAAESSGAAGGSGTVPAPSAPTAPAPPPPSASDDAVGHGEGGSGMEDMFYEYGEGRVPSALEEAENMARAVQMLLERNASVALNSRVVDGDLPVFSDLPVPPPGAPFVSSVPNRLRTAAPDLDRRVWTYGAWIVPLQQGVGVLAAVPPGAPQRWLHITPRMMAKALALWM